MTTPALTQVTDMMIAKQLLLRKQPTGYSGIDGARKLLNDMIYESMSKYDAEIAKCKQDLAKLNKRLKIVMGDIKVMTMILEMTDCEKKLLQMKEFALLHCTDQCTKKSFIQFNHDGLQQKIGQLQSSLSHDLMQDSFADLFEGIEALESVEFLQVDSHQTPIINKTKFSNPPVPKTAVPKNPCNDPYQGA